MMMVDDRERLRDFSLLPKREIDAREGDSGVKEKGFGRSKKKRSSAFSYVSSREKKEKYWAKLTCNWAENSIHELGAPDGGKGSGDGGRRGARRTTAVDSRRAKEQGNSWRGNSSEYGGGSPARGGVADSRQGFTAKDDFAGGGGFHGSD
ncbi:extra-large GTP-binding protein 3 [Striga asiatica]|uniref:Extra-large GTP-binding protein 3 n=1 Tax=Striga asiatica TaxID=4170 RepID=A0A5A7Q5C7_STRAF|nr:extra-large GTP-binding protein 3 [Striga asiatica]